jgi:phosphohistidine phosphatase SixA
MVVVVVLPFAQFVVEQVNVVGHSALVQELVKLLIVDSM